MNKIIATAAAASFALVAGVAFSASTIGTGATIKNAQCGYIPASNNDGVKLTPSANVAAVYECTSTGVVTGAAHTQGKKKAFISTSAGGSQAEATLSANPTNASTDITSLITGGASWTDLVGQLT